MGFYTSVSRRPLKMAGSAVPLISVGDFVNYDGKTCYVENVFNNIGFNQYVIVDIDTGTVFTKARYQIQPVDVEMVTGSDTDIDPFPDINIEDLMQKNEDKTPKTEESRFVTISNEDLDNLELNRNSLRTKSQTSWAVSIFRGETLACSHFEIPAKKCMSDLPT